MRKKLCFVLLIAAVFSTSNVLADQSQNPSETQSTRYPWSVGAGVGLSVYSQFSLADPLPGSSLGGGLRGFGSNLSPFGLVLLEKQLSDQLALTFDVSGSYSNLNRHYDSAGDYYGFNSKNRYLASAAVGVRWILNPGGAVEVSGLASVSGLISGEEGEFTDRETDENLNDYYVNLNRQYLTYSLGGGVGIAFERKLIDNLFLRFQTSLLQAYWGKNSVTAEQLDGTNDTDQNSIFNIGLAFTPMIQLRLEI